MDPFTAMLIAQGASGVLSGFTGESTSGNKRRAKNTLFNDLLPNIRQFGGQRMNQLTQGLQASLKGFDQAKIATSAGSRAARRSALDTAKEEQGALTAAYGGATGRTTALDMARSSLTARTTRRLQDVDRIFADALSGLEIGRGSAEAQGRQAISGLLGEQQGYENEVFKKLFDIRSRGQFGSVGAGYQHEPTPGQGLDLSGLYALLQAGGTGG